MRLQNVRASTKEGARSTLEKGHFGNMRSTVLLTEVKDVISICGETAQR